MSNDFYLMVLEIPEVITLEYVKSLKDKARSIDLETAYILNNFINYDIEEIDISEDLDEEDLYNLDSDDIRIKHAAKMHLLDAIDRVISPRIGMSQRMNISLLPSSVRYINIGGHTYVASGYESTYMSKSPSKAYSYLVALNVSSIINL
tara:strand:- start:4073 stop:4519 length:447 start_codon:yes stop_codon:yes gene_type:complete